jgi:hypothetical protein
MAAITAITASGQPGFFTSTGTVLSASDTITVDDNKTQLLVLTNTTGGALTCTVDGTTASAAYAPGGVGAISLTAGYPIAVPAGQSRSIVLASIREYTRGVCQLLGGDGLTAQLFNL